MAWIITILIAFWGLPLLTMLAVGIACLVSDRFRLAAARILGLHAAPPSSAQARNPTVRGRVNRPLGDL